MSTNSADMASLVADPGRSRPCVPPLFGKKTFVEVVNNYGGKSFKDTLQHLESAARKVADTHLHMPVRKSETLPTAEQVSFASHLDVLLSEIVRITK